MRFCLVFVFVVLAVSASPVAKESQKRFLKFTDITDTIQHGLQSALHSVFGLPNLLLHNFAPSTPSPEQLANLQPSSTGENEIII